MKKKLMKILLFLIVAAVLCEAVLFTLVYVNAKKPSNAVKSDVLIVLGARVWPRGNMSNVLEHRVRAALDGYRSGIAENIIVCGAQGSDEPDTEANVMKRFFTGQGVPEERIFCEDQSFNTKQNLMNAKAIMQEHGWTTAVVVTSDYHMARALWLARDVGLNATGIKAEAADYLSTRVKNLARETASWVFYVLRK